MALLCHTFGEKILFWYQQDAKLIYTHRGSSEISVGLPFKILKMCNPAILQLIDNYV